jgi:hypothetical protein
MYNVIDLPYNFSFTLIGCVSKSILFKSPGSLISKKKLQTLYESTFSKFLPYIFIKKPIKFWKL